MKKGVVVISSVCLILSALLLLSTQGSRSEENRRIESWAKLFLKLNDNPFIRPWLDEAVEELRASGLWEHYKAALPQSLQDQFRAAVGKSFTLTFPHTVNGQDGNQIVKTTAILLNNSETNANGRVFLRQRDGSPMSVRTNQGTGSFFDFSLLPGETFRLETDGSGPLLIGWIEVVSDIQLSGSGAFALFSSSGQFLSEVGIGDSPRARSLMIFVDTQEGKNTAYAISNPSASTTARLTLQLKRLDGTLVASRENVSLGPLNQKAEFVNETFPTTDLRNFRGVLLITTTDTDVAVTTLRTRGIRLTSLPSAPAISDTSKQGTAYLARVGDGVFGTLKFQTSAVFMNNSDKKGTVTLELFKQEGTAMEVVTAVGRNDKFTVEVPAGGALELLSDGSANPGATGWARATSDIPLSVSGTFTIKNNASGEFVSEVGVPSSSESTKLSTFVQVSGDIDTGLGLTNIEGFSKNIMLRLVAEGAPLPVAEKPLPLGARGHTGLFVSELFSEVPQINQRNFVGRLEAEGFGITALTLRTRGVFLTSLPVAAFNRAAFAPKLTITTATSLEGSKPALCLQISQNAGEAMPHKALLRFDKGSIDFSEFPQDPNPPIIGIGIQNMLGFLINGYCFATQTTSSSSQFYCVPTPDGVHETTPFIGVLANTGNTGFVIGIEANPGQYASLPIGGTSNLCFHSDLIQLPSGATEMNVSQEYESFEQTPDAGDILKRSATSIITTSTLPAGSPRIDSVSPTRAAAGTELLVRGSNFAATPAGNSVTVEGNSRIAVTVTAASSTLLKMKLPENAVTGALRVETGGRSSNDYSLDVPFAPQTTLAFGSLAANQETTLKLTMTQKSGQIAFLKVTAKPSQGSWKTSGFSAGTILGTMKLLNTTYDLKVKSSDSNKLAIDVVEQGKSDISYTIEATNSGGPSLLLAPATFPDTVELRTNLAFELTFTQTVFRMPAGAAIGFNVDLEVVSMPERNNVEETAFMVFHKKSFTTN